jgi:hypothetical protein
MLAAVAIIIVATGCQNDKQSSPTKANAAITAYINVNQIVEKSGITDFERNIIAGQLVKEIRNYNDAEFITAAIADFNNTGIDFDSPVYATIDITDEGTIDVVMIAKVADVEKLDRLAEIVLQYVPNTNIETRGSNRYFVTADNILPAIGYNDNYLALVMSQNGNSRQFLDKVLRGYEVDATIFNSLDAGVAINLNKVANVANLILDTAILRVQMYAEIYKGKEDEYDFNERIATLDKIKSTLNSISNKFEDNASLVAGVEFKSGEAVLNVEINGIKQEGLMATRPVNNSYLTNLPADLLAIANINIDGKAAANILEQNKDIILSNLNVGSVIPYIDIIIDAIKSLDGDITLAVNKLEFHKEYDWYYDDYDYELRGFDFDLYATVCDRYIFDNVVNLPGINNYLKPVGNDIFAINAAGMNILFGQNGNTLYVGSDDTAETTESNATFASWYPRVSNGSYGYLILNLQQLLKSDLGAQILDSFEKKGNYNAIEAARNFLDNLDYVAINLPQSNKLELAVVFNDRTTNALKQIITTIKRVALVGDGN